MCVCYCDDTRLYSDRYVSTQEHESNITNNEVITGIRVVKVERVIYLQIQVGKLILGQKIDQSTVRWVPINRVKSIDPAPAMRGEDYVVIRRDTPFDLDTWTLDDDYVVTGKFF